MILNCIYYYYCRSSHGLHYNIIDLTFCKLLHHRELPPVMESSYGIVSVISFDPFVNLKYFFFNSVETLINNIYIYN